jgi:hypothetical protein
MSYIKVRSVSAVLSLLIFAIPGLAGDYSDPKGYSFTYPDGWVIVTKQLWENEQKNIPAEIQSWLQKSKVDLSGLSVVLIREGHEEFLENLNVSIDNQEIPANDDSIKKLSTILPQKYRELGVTINKVDGQLKQYGKNQALVIDFHSQLPFMPFPLRQNQVFFPGGGKTYIVTCTTRQDTFDKYSQTFDTILASFKVPAPNKKGIDWNHVLITTVIGGAVGAVGGGLYALIKKLNGKKSQRSISESQS